VAVVVILVAAGFFWRWHYRECKAIGGSTAYCLFDR
jgi:hypothetical protein